MKGFVAVTYRTNKRDYQFVLRREGQMVTATCDLPDGGVNAHAPNLLELMAVEIPGAVNFHEEDSPCTAAIAVPA